MINIMIPTKSEIKNVIAKSREEFVRYKRTKDIVYLQEAGNKLYKALGMLVEFIEKKDIKTSKGIEMNRWTLINKGILNERMMSDVVALHSFFYEGVGEEKYYIRMYRRAQPYMLKVLRKRK